MHSNHNRAIPIPSQRGTAFTAGRTTASLDEANLGANGASQRRRRGRWLAAICATLAMLVATMTVGAAAVAGEARTSSAAAAAPGAVTAAPVPVHGIVEDGTNQAGVQIVPEGTPFDGTFQVKRFEARKGVLYAVGRLTGTMGAVNVARTVALPVNGASNEAPDPVQASGASAAAAQIVPTPGACDLLTLDLGPLDLDLLGLPRGARRGAPAPRGHPRGRKPLGQPPVWRGGSS